MEAGLEVRLGTEVARVPIMGWLWGDNLITEYKHESDFGGDDEIGWCENYIVVMGGWMHVDVYAHHGTGVWGVCVGG